MTYNTCMIDIQFVRDNPGVVKEKSAAKGYEVDIDQLLGFDKERRELLGQVETLRRERNELSAAAKGQKPLGRTARKGARAQKQVGRFGPSPQLDGRGGGNAAARRAKHAAGRSAGGTQRGKKRCRARGWLKAAVRLPAQSSLGNPRA